ncbi:hypothetical protein U0070_004780 [Myodes glareolus]|uniref:Uncharacterized protein n=1 Tax=Myodes glareolus TaxID=447135 RepID=A0AAW0HVD6_MYOGA
MVWYEIVHIIGSLYQHRLPFCVSNMSLRQCFQTLMKLLSVKITVNETLSWIINLLFIFCASHLIVVIFCYSCSSIVYFKS